jgi:L-fucose mutarotase
MLQPARAYYDHCGLPEGDAVLRTPLIHPPLLAALAGAGHGGKVLIADANYSASTNVNPAAARIHLNVRPGLVTVADVLEPVLATVPVEAVEVMTPDGGGTPEVWGVYQQMLREGLTLRQLGRFDFYAAGREPDVAVCVATGDAALYSNVLLTIGYLTPEGEDGPPA